MSVFNQPANLSEKGEKARQVIIAFLTQKDLTYTGGCTPFASPKEWAERGEEYGCDSELVIIHDGGDLAPVFNLDYGGYTLQEEITRLLHKEGVFVEQCTSWYSAVYEM